MTRSVSILLVLCLWCAVAQANHGTLRSDVVNTNPIDSAGQTTAAFATQLREHLDHELAQRLAVYSAPFVSQEEACLHGTSPSLTSAPFACIAYTPHRIHQTATAITYNAVANDVCWTILSADDDGIAGWTRVGTTAYYYDCEGDVTPNRPDLPPNSVWLMRVIITASAIAQVEELYQLYPYGVDQAERFPSFASALDEYNDAGDPAIVLRVSSPLTVTANSTVPPNVVLQVTRTGQLTLDPGVTLTLPCANLLADPAQIFTGTGAVACSDGMPVQAAWWPKTSAGLGQADASTTAPVFLTPGTWTIGTNLTVSSKLVADPIGGRLDVAAGIVLTLGQCPMAGRQQLFSTNLMIVFTATGCVLNPEWWGATGMDASDDQPAIHGMNFAAKAGHMTLDFPPGVYNIGGSAEDPAGAFTSITLNNVEHVLLRGNGATLQALNTSTRLLGLYNSDYVQVTGFHFIGHTQTISQQKHGIAIGYNSSHIEIVDNSFTNFTGDCVAVAGNFADGTQTGFDASQVRIHNNICKSRVGNGITSANGGTGSRLGMSVTAGRYIRIYDNLIYGIVGIEPDVNNIWIYHVTVENNTFVSGPVTPQAVIGTNYIHDEPVLVPGPGGTVIDGGMYFQGIPAAPLVGEVGFHNNRLERGTIVCGSSVYVCNISWNTFNEGLIQVSDPSGTGEVSYAYVVGNTSKNPYPGQTTFIKLAGFVTFGTFLNNTTDVDGGYVIDDNGAGTGDNGRNVFLGNTNRSATAAGHLGFTPLPTSVAANQWAYTGAALETLTHSVTTGTHLGSFRTITVETDCFLDAGKYACNFAALPATTWLLQASGAVTINKIVLVPPGTTLKLRSNGAFVYTIEHTNGFIQLDADANFAMDSDQDVLTLEGISTNTVNESARVDE